MKEVCTGASSHHRIEMIYNFFCESCSNRESFDASIKVGPPSTVVCVQCTEPGMKVEMVRDWRADRPHVNTSACRDHDDIPERARVARPFAANDPGRESAAREEAKFQRHINERRRQLRDGNNGTIRHTHSVPADLFHGKIRETGDRNYWDDPGNVARHKSTQVS